MKTILCCAMLMVLCSVAWGEENVPVTKKGFMQTHKDLANKAEQVAFRKELETMGHTIFFKALESKPKMQAAIDYAVEQEGDAHSRKLLLIQNMRIIELLEKIAAKK